MSVQSRARRLTAVDIAGRNEKERACEDDPTNGQIWEHSGQPSQTRAGRFRGHRHRDAGGPGDVDTEGGDVETPRVAPAGTGAPAAVSALR